MTGEASTRDGARIRRLLQRRDAAVVRHRAAVARRLGLTDSEMLAITHLAHQGDLMPSRLAALMELSSGGTSALIQRLEMAGHVVRQPNPVDRRSSLIRLQREIAARIDRADARLLDHVDRMAAALHRDEREVILEFLSELAGSSEALAETVIGEGAGNPLPERAVPSLWA